MIYITHGSLSLYNSERISHALFLPESRVENHLRSRRSKYVPLAQALNGDGDALTIDDATYAGLRLALLARQHGHAVSWFVNGANIEHGQPYYPFQLSCMLDNTRVKECHFEGQTWTLQTVASRRALRLHVKAAYMRMRSRDEIERLINTLSCCLRVNAAMMERSLCTVGPADLCHAVVAGVDLQNHSWSHLNPQVMSEEERTAEVLQNEKYLSQFRKAATRVFAPPFGQQVSLTSVSHHYVLLANRDLGSDHREGNLANRGDLLLHESTRPPDRTSHSNSGRIAA
jgi:peptidoglycan/xylan/chitin deacetylase (PgdA/CDA1 family)